LIFRHDVCTGLHRKVPHLLAELIVCEFARSNLPACDEEFRDSVIRAAKRHEIQLEPEQVTVERTGTPQTPIIFLAADYKARVVLLAFSFTLHFHPSSAK